MESGGRTFRISRPKLSVAERSEPGRCFWLGCIRWLLGRGPRADVVAASDATGTRPSRSELIPSLTHRNQVGNRKRVQAFTPTAFLTVAWGKHKRVERACAPPQETR